MDKSMVFPFWLTAYTVSLCRRWRPEDMWAESWGDGSNSKASCWDFRKWIWAGVGETWRKPVHTVCATTSLVQVSSDETRCH